MLNLTLDELAQAADADLGCSHWVHIDQARIDAFAAATEDRQWIHVDPARAASGPFGTTIAHGHLTLSLVSNFLLEVLVVRDAATVINYGLDRVRFPAPVPVGAQIRGRGRLLAVTSRDNGVQTTARFTVECDAVGKPVAIADVLTRFQRGSAAATSQRGHRMSGSHSDNEHR